ncbi:CLUMA_CG003203, isoform A [Clunio marinus]|uniref:CLUMA_CG003203, isoform A n=1 Tax=Clunio marinus TaxID=568069 RepID=A0A1J1HSK8_9DIPT|nr:CLUMA_CG003203, isoform A [Clunio marinus]
MTIKTLLQTTNINNITAISDMQKRKVKRNLFNTTVDRDELQRQLGQLENESLRTLQSFECDSVIGVINSASEDQARKHKRWPEQEGNHDLQGSLLIRDHSTDTEASSSSNQTAQSSTSKKTTSKLIQALPKGQRTLTDYFPRVKRTRKHR